MDLFFFRYGQKTVKYKPIPNLSGEMKVHEHYNMII